MFTSTKPQNTPNKKSGVQGDCFYNLIRVLFFAGIFSLISEIMYSKSITAHIVGALESCPLAKVICFVVQGICPEWCLDYFKEFPDILRAEVIFEIVKVLGFGSILISMIQTLMDKKTFGVSYADIIKEDYQYFRQILVIHLLATIMCIGFSAAGASEGALITLIVMLLGFLYFWIIIDNLLLHTKRREEQAINILKNKLFEQRNNRDSLFSTVQKIATEVSKNCDSETDDLIPCFSHALVLYCRQISNVTGPFERMSIIRDVAATWGIVLSQKSATEQARRVGKVIVEGLKKDADIKDMIVACSGLILHQYTYLDVQTGNELNQNEYDFLMYFSNYIHSINGVLQEHMYNGHSKNTVVDTEKIKTIQRYQITLCSMLMWMQVLKQHINLTPALFEMVIDRGLWEYEEMLRAVVCSANLTNATNNDYHEQEMLVYDIYRIVGFQREEDVANVC